MTFYAGQLLYCIDKDHPYYGKRLKVDTSLLEMGDGTPAICDIATGKPIDLKIEQLSFYAPN